MTTYNSISFSGLRLSHKALSSMGRKYECMCCVQSSEMSGEEEELVYSFKPQTPLLDKMNVINNQNSWSKCLPLPTPEEKMRQQAQSVTADIVPINITGENFDRQASFRRTVINTDTIIRRSKRVKRRKTITGVPDNIKKELANNEQPGIRTQSIYTTGQHSSLGHAESSSSLKHLLPLDSGCQTDDAKIVPPSMRRIRSQRGPGISAQMANMSLSSSGSVPNTSDCSTQQLNASDQGFHTLPRQGARICLQNLEAIGSSTSLYLTVCGSTSSLPYQVTMQNASPDSQHMSNLTSGYMVSNHSSSTSSLNAGIVLQNVRNLNPGYSSQNFEREVTPLHPMPNCTSDHPFNGTSCSASSSSCQSPASSFHMASETESQCSTLDSRNLHSGCEDSDMSENSIHSSSILTTNIWAAYCNDQRTSGCSSPTSIACSSLEHSAKNMDASSLFSINSEGCYSSVHLVPDSKSYGHGCIKKAGNTSHKVYGYRDNDSHDDSASLYSNHSLTRSISLRKAKKPPLPPKRTDSLQRKPQRKHHTEKRHNGSNLHESLKSHTASFSGQMPSSGLEDSWVLGQTSQSSVSIASSGMSAPAAMCPSTPTLSDSSSQHSEYNESWDFHMDFPHSCSESGPASQIIRPVVAKENSRALESNGNPLTACIKTGINIKMAASPDKVQLLTSPSSGYSSQSITPITGTPVISLLRAKSPAGRTKPKVPERKSSLRSSVSTYSSPVSPETSNSVKSLSTPPPIPKTLPGLVTLKSNSAGPKPSFIMPNASPTTPVSSPLATTSQSSQIVSSTIPDECKTSLSLSPDSEVSSHLMVIENTMSPLPLPPPPPPLPLSSTVHTKHLNTPLAGTGLQKIHILNATNSPLSLETMENGKEFKCKRSDKPANHDRPVITAQALTNVQLRPIKLMKLENIFTDILTTVCGPEKHEHNKEPRTKRVKSLETENVKHAITPDSVGPLENGMNTTEFPSKESTPTLLVSNPCDLHDPPSYTHSTENVLEHSLDTGPACSTVLQTKARYNETLQDQRSPVSSKKANNSMIMTPIMNRPALNDIENLELSGSAVFSEPETRTDYVKQHEIPLLLNFEDESDHQNSTPTSPRRHSLSSEISSDSLTDPQLAGLALSDQDNGLCNTDLGLHDKDLVLSDDKGIMDDSSSSSGSVIFREDENDENDAVFDFGTDSSSPTFSSTGEDIDDMLAPARPRTTDDLFAAIHRSKRKVLGRCESEEERSRSFSTSPPITPTSSSPSMSWMPRQNSYVQQRLRPSATSNDRFKALLLKKGSRSEPGFRMSATEMLKYTDPRLQRSNAEVSSPFCTSPGRSRRASEEWARAEGALPRLSPSLTHSKYGRSSTPPCAASSRYNSRSRIPSGPMTVICEREGEQSESMDLCNISFPVSLSSTGTVCAQGST